MRHSTKNVIALAIRSHEANGFKTANMLRLFIIPAVPENIQLHPKTSGEISAIEWFPLSKLPSGPGVSAKVGSQRFWMVSPVVAPLRNWVAAVKTRRREAQRRVQKPKHAEAKVPLRNACPCARCMCFAPGELCLLPFDDDRHLTCKSTQARRADAGN